MSPMERSLAWLRAHGYEAAKTEHWNHFAKCRQDLFGFIDILAVTGDTLLAIQCSDREHHAAHRAKILKNKAARLLVYHMEIEIWSWGLNLTRDRRKDGLLDRRKQYKLVRDNLVGQLLPRKSVLARKRLAEQLL